MSTAAGDLSLLVEDVLLRRATNPQHVDAVARSDRSYSL
jgi:hypothetical protein